MTLVRMDRSYPAEQVVLIESVWSDVLDASRDEFLVPGDPASAPSLSISASGAFDAFVAHERETELVVTHGAIAIAARLALEVVRRVGGSTSTGVELVGPWIPSEIDAIDDFLSYAKLLQLPADDMLLQPAFDTIFRDLLCLLMAHELAHILFGHLRHEAWRCDTKNGDSRELSSMRYAYEFDADRFAARVLLRTILMRGTVEGSTEDAMRRAHALCPRFVEGLLGLDASIEAGVLIVGLPRVASSAVILFGMQASLVGPTTASTYRHPIERLSYLASHALEYADFQAMMFGDFSRRELKGPITISSGVDTSQISDIVRTQRWILHDMRRISEVLRGCLRVDAAKDHTNTLDAMTDSYRTWRKSTASEIIRLRTETDRLKLCPFPRVRGVVGSGAEWLVRLVDMRIELHEDEKPPCRTPAFDVRPIHARIERLRSLSSPVKELLIEQSATAAGAHEVARRIEFIEFEIESLQAPEFWKMCSELGTIKSTVELVARIGVMPKCEVEALLAALEDMSGPAPEHLVRAFDWLEYGQVLKNSPRLLLYCSTNCIAQRDLDHTLVSRVCRALNAMGLGPEAVSVFESYRDRVPVDVGASALGRCARCECRGVIISTGDTARRGERGRTTIERCAGCASLVCNKCMLRPATRSMPTCPMCGSEVV